MITFVTFKWKTPGYRSVFTAGHVNTWKSMIDRNYSKPHRCVLVTDDPLGVDSSIEIVPLWDDHSTLVSPKGKFFPSCYRRLKLFSAEAKEIFGERIVNTDLDIVITGDITPLFDREEDFVCWGDTARNTAYNGSLWMLRTGTRCRVWDEFDPVMSPRLTYKANIIGSDQAWMSYVLGPNEPKWGKQDGVYSYRVHLLPSGQLPTNARVVLFHGKVDPWTPGIADKFPWVKKHYL